MPDITQGQEQIVGLNLSNEVLFIVDASNSGINFSKRIEELRTDTGYNDLHSLVTIPSGIFPPSALSIYTASPAPKHDFTREDGGFFGSKHSGEAQRSQFTDFSNQYFFMQDYTHGPNGLIGDGAGITGCGDYILGEEVEQSVHRIYTRGRTGSLNDKPFHSGSNINYAYSSGFFGGSAGNPLGGTGGFLEILGTTQDTVYPQGLSLAGHQALKIQFWFNFDGVYPPDGTVLFGKKLAHGAGGSGPFYMDYDATNTKLRFNASIGNTGASFNKTVSGALVAGITVGWHHCQVERSNDYLRIFIDGVMKDQTEVTNSNHWYGGETNSFSIGAEINGGNAYRGYMSDFHYAAGDITGTKWLRIIDGPSGGTMQTNETISTPAEIGTGDAEYTKLLIPMQGISGCKNFVERGFNVVTGRATGWYSGGPSGSTTSDTGIRLTVSNIGVTGAATGFTTGSYGFVYGFSGTGGTGCTGAGFGGTYGFTGSMAAYAISYIPSDDVLGITASKAISISIANDNFKTDLALGVSGSTGATGGAQNDLKWLFGISGGNTAARCGSGKAGISGAGVTGPPGTTGAGCGGGYFDKFIFKLTPDTFEILASQAAAVEAGFSGDIVVVGQDGTAETFRPQDITLLHRDISVFFQERSASHEKTKGNIESVSNIFELTNVGGKGNIRTVNQKDIENSVSYKQMQDSKSGTSYSFDTGGNGK